MTGLKIFLHAPLAKIYTSFELKGKRAPKKRNKFGRNIRKKVHKNEFFGLFCLRKTILFIFRENFHFF